MFDTTGLAEAVQAMRAAVTATDAYVCRVREKCTPARYSDIDVYRDQEQAAGRDLLATLEGVPERLALLEQLEVYASAVRALVLPQNERLRALAKAAGDLWDASIPGLPPDDEPLVAAVRDALTALGGLEEKARDD